MTDLKPPDRSSWNNPTQIFASQYVNRSLSDSMTRFPLINLEFPISIQDAFQTNNQCISIKRLMILDCAPIHLFALRKKLTLEIVRSNRTLSRGLVTANSPQAFLVDLERIIGTTFALTGNHAMSL